MPACKLGGGHDVPHRAQHPVPRIARLGEEVRAVAKAGADLIHFDVMDNHYVPNLTVTAGVRGAAPARGLPLDVHLMVKPVEWPGSGVRQGGANIIASIPRPPSTSTALSP